MNTNTLIGLLIGYGVGMSIVIFKAKKKVKKIGQIKCNRCGYQGLATLFVNVFNFKIICPDCNGETWKKISL